MTGGSLWPLVLQVWAGFLSRFMPAILADPGGLLEPRPHTVCVHFLSGNVGSHVTFRGHAWQ